jgi:hypothetical protein
MLLYAVPHPSRLTGTRGRCIALHLPSQYAPVEIGGLLEVSVVRMAHVEASWTWKRMPDACSRTRMSIISRSASSSASCSVATCDSACKVSVRALCNGQSTILVSSSDPCPKTSRSCSLSGSPLPSILGKVVSNKSCAARCSISPPGSCGEVIGK